MSCGEGQLNPTAIPRSNSNNGTEYELSISNDAKSGSWKVFACLNEDNWINNEFTYEFAEEHPSAYFEW